MIHEEIDMKVQEKVQETMKQSIIDRATDYAYMVAGESPDIVLAGEAYQRGAEDEHRLLTEYKIEPPTNGERVLLKVKDGNDGRIRHTVGYRTEEWNGENLTHYDTVIGWRKIHE